MFDLDDEYFFREGKFKEEDVMPSKKGDSNKKYGVGLDVGTGFLVGSGFKGNKISYTPLRDAFFVIDREMFNKSMFNKSQMKYIEIENNVFVIGEDALNLAKIRNASAKRPLANGVINPKEREAAPILKEMFRYCVEPFKSKDGEKLVFSVPGKQVGSESFDVEYHSMSIQSLASTLGFDAHPLNEAYAVVISEMEKADDVTGLGFSFGAGLVNVAFVYKSMLLFEFSIGKSGDFVDKESSKATGVSESMINHIKETKLDLSGSEFEMSPEERALLFTYRHVIKNTINEVIRAFKETENVNIIESVPIILSGGTTLPKGFVELFKSELDKSDIPFQYSKIVPAKDRLKSVSRGCLLWANHLEGE